MKSEFEKQYPNAILGRRKRMKVEAVFAAIIVAGLLYLLFNPSPRWEVWWPNL